jgi:cytochrome P450
MAQREHDTEAPLFRAALTSVDLDQHEQQARATCSDMLARLSTASLQAEVGIVPRGCLQQWVFTSLAGVFFGVSPDDERLEELFAANEGLAIARGGGPRWRRRLEQSFVSITGLMRQQARAWSSAEPDRMRATVLGTVLMSDPHILEDPARARNLILVFRLGTSDLTSLLDWVLLQLTEHPEWQGTVHSSGTAADAAHRARQDTVAHHVVQETLRLEQSEYLYREVVRPFAINGFHVPAGWLLRVCVQESHRDPAIFPDPDRFDPGRFAQRGVSRREYSPFGVDDHGCMGVPMVHFFGRIFVEQLCRGFKARVTRDAPLEKGTRHRDHWRPGTARLVRLVPLESTTA